MDYFYIGDTDVPVRQRWTAPGYLSSDVRRVWTMYARIEGATLGLCTRPKTLRRGVAVTSLGARPKKRVFTARRYASAVLAVVVCPSVCLSVTSRYCIETATHRITQTTPYGSPGNLVF